MTNILFVTFGLYNGGTEMFMMNIIRYADRSRFHFDFLINTTDSSCRSEEAEKLGCHIYRLPARRKIWAYYKELKNFFKVHGKKYDALHWNGSHLSILFATLLAAKRYHIPIRIIHAHNSSAYRFRWRAQHWINKHFVQCIGTHFFACSSKAATFFYDKKPAVVINNGIDTYRFRYDSIIREEIRKELHIPKENIVLGHVGHFLPVKNHSYLLDIFKAFHDEHPESTLLLLGSGETQPVIRKKSISLGLQNNVIFAGGHTDVERYYQAMDAFVMPSLFEGLPFVLVEAQASGLPCFVSDNINHDAKLTPTFHFLNIHDNPKHWANIISQCLTTYQRYDTQQIIIEKGYSIHKLISFMERVYEGKE